MVTAERIELVCFSTVIRSLVANDERGTGADKSCDGKSFETCKGLGLQACVVQEVSQEVKPGGCLRDVPAQDPEPVEHLVVAFILCFEDVHGVILIMVEQVQGRQDSQSGQSGIPGREPHRRGQDVF